MPIPPIPHKRGLDFLLLLRWTDKVDGYRFSAVVEATGFRRDLECRPLLGSCEIEIWCAGADQADWPVGPLRCDIVGDIDGALAGSDTFQIKVIPGVKT